jgi:Na+/melibiose symporter-like transporter
VGIFAVVVCSVVIPSQVKKTPSKGGLDIPGIVISGLGLFMLTLGLVQGNSWGWRSPAIVGLLVAAVVTFPVFIWWELRTPSPMFPVKLLRIRSFTAANTSIMFIGMAMGGTFLMVVIFMVSVLAYSELRAALALTVMPIIALVIAPNAGRLNDRIGPRLPAAAGAACFAVGLILLAQLGGGTTLWDVMWRVAFMGAGMGLAMPTLSAASMASLPPEVRGVGSGSLNTMRQVGFTIGVALLVAIFTHTVAQNAQQATRQAVGFVAAQQQLSPAEKGMYSAAILKNAKQAASSGGGAAVLTTYPLKGAPRPPAGTPQALTWRKVNAGAAAIYKHDIARSFSWPFYAAALAALLAIPAALFTGRRLGADAGHDEMTREERAADRTLAAEEATAAAGSSATVR